MLTNALVHGFGSIGMFSSRAFLPAFITAFSLRYGDVLPYMKNIDLVNHVGQEPVWFTHGATLTILGFLSILEMAADKVPEARLALQEIDGYTKTALAGLSFLGLISAVDIDFIEKTITHAGVFDTVFTVFVAGAAYIASRMRKGLLEVLRTADEDDDFGIQNFISWVEDIWAAFGILALLFFPILMLVVNGVALGILFIAQKYVTYREEKSKVDCNQCGESVYRTAMACPQCGEKREQPSKVGALGQSKKKAEDDLEAHPYFLVAKKRCPVCATRFKKRSVNQTCDACGHQLLADKDFARNYLHRIRTRVPGVCLISFLFSLIPVIGLVPGVIYYRLRLVGPFRQYTPLSQSFILKWLIRLLFSLLISLQWIPGLGGFVIPAMALISYSIFSAQFRIQTGI